ncbi:hypothetical protein ABIB40_003202 [Pedobacter sp. UYP30]|uniref:hypothetical protein n=1 Tax=Pedobacter sp. UYP30 TaxID=1756400 RepID=UPI0033948F40
MVQQPTPIVIDLKDTVKERIYCLETRTKLRVQKMYFENNTTTIVKQTLLGTNIYSNNDLYECEGYIIQIDVLSFKQTAKDELNQLFEDINTVTDKLVLQTDNFGCIQEVLNIDEVLAKWTQLKPLLIEKHKEKPNAFEFFNAFELKLKSAGELEVTIENKGIYGILFAGIYDRDLGETYDLYKTLDNYFANISLPIKITNKVTEITTTKEIAPKPNKWSLLANPTKYDSIKLLEIKSIHSSINEDEFKKGEFATLIKTMTDDIKADTTLQFLCEENYCVGQEDGWLVKASQLLRTEVAGIYMSEVSNKLTVQN